MIDELVYGVVGAVYLVVLGGGWGRGWRRCTRGEVEKSHYSNKSLVRTSGTPPSNPTNELPRE